MVRELFSEDIIDIVMFFKENNLKKKNDYIINVKFNIELYTARAIRKLFFDNELSVYAEINQDGDVQDIIMVDIKGNNKLNSCNIILFNVHNIDLLNFMLKDIWQKRENILKVRVLVTTLMLRERNSDWINKSGFINEICLREFSDDNKNIYSYVFLK